MSLININGGAGFSISGNVLQQFLADGSVLIAADTVVPEPSTIVLLLIAILSLGCAKHRIASSKCLFAWDRYS